MTETHSLTHAKKDRLVALANFLRNRRERLTPEKAGITTTTRRRTPGLRREELAQLAGVSVSWYTWLEQGRDISVSDEVLDSISRVLGLSATEHHHLFQLSRDQSVSPNPLKERNQQVSDDLQPILNSFGHHPAYLLDQCWNLVAGNQTAYNLFVNSTVTDYEELPWREKNLLWVMFTNPYQQDLLVDWEIEAKRCTGLFRFSSSSHIGEPWYNAFINDLKTVSPHFKKWWPDYDIQPPDSKQKNLSHPVVGALVLQATTLLIPEYPDLQLVVYTPLEKDTATKLATLATLHYYF